MNYTGQMYVIGLALRNSHKKDIIAQVSPFSSRLLRLSSLISALEADPDLAQIPLHNYPEFSKRSMFLQVVTTFQKLGKATFLRYFFRYANLRMILPPQNLRDPVNYPSTVSWIT